MLSQHTIAIVKSTIPLLESAGIEVTDHFYQRMFRHNPELKDIFNMANQANGRQQFALFSAVAAYAKYIDQLDVLGTAVERIAQKHTSFHIQPEHYPIIGHHLLATLKELAPDQVTDEVAQAWGEAYQFLADILIDREKTLYQASATQPGGWEGPRQFRVTKKYAETEQICSFELTPVDGGLVRDYLPGQYLAVKVRPPQLDYDEIRQYSLSDRYTADHYRISVKREQQSPAGLVSNYLHDEVNVGDVIEVMPPAGAFYFTPTNASVVLISAGVGITPMMAILETLVAQTHTQSVQFIHATAKPEHHAFKQRLAELNSQHSWLTTHFWYSQVAPADSTAYSGYIDLNLLDQQLDYQHAEFYVCGPVSFMRFIRDALAEKQVDKHRIHYEIFGPHEEI